MTGGRANGRKPAGGHESDPAVTREVTLTPLFRLTFFSVLALTALSAIACVALSQWGREGEETRRLVETFSSTWKLGFGAILGLLSGKAIE